MNCYKAEYARNSRNHKYGEYISHVNKYGGAYQDDFEPNDYDPTGVVKLDVNLPTRLKDPTTLPQRKNYNEINTIYRCNTGRNFTQKQVEKTKLPIIVNDNQTRADLDWNDWLLNQYNTVESTVRNRSA